MHEHEGQIEQSIDAGVPLFIIEGLIDELCLPADEAEALKLYAWAWAETKPKRRSRQLLARVRSPALS